MYTDTLKYDIFQSGHHKGSGDPRIHQYYNLKYDEGYKGGGTPR